MGKLILLVAGTIVVCVFTKPAVAQAVPEAITVNFDQEFADVEAASKYDPAISAALYRAALKRINAISYADWLADKEAKFHPPVATRPGLPE